MAEYVASFWNPDGVKRIKEARTDAENHSFQNNKEFEDYILSGEFKNNKYVNAILDIRKHEEGEDENANNNSIKEEKRQFVNNLHFLKDFNG